ncbi:hypothetical protein CRE_18436 [Caenorhabditis remanei]|uniref:Endonuclease/exonuclease/phosphatase domain-containing protein n=1 Tax=Caenorhabditis remanei TaxID=31234 RepID=E3LKB3_CAERE|nr:hypothetical protein CRE_18436 [Caenorhabditis remanei]
MQQRRYNPYEKRTGFRATNGTSRGTFKRFAPRQDQFQRGGVGRGSRYSEQYTWQEFQSSEMAANNHIPILHPFNISPPKPIETIRLTDVPSTSTVPTVQSDHPGSANICSSWLAKNQCLTRHKKVEEIVVDERNNLTVVEDVADDDSDIVILEEPKDEEEKEDLKNRKIEKKKKKKKRTLSTLTASSDDSIVIIGEYSSTAQNNTTMTQLETKMAETFWSNNSASSSNLIQQPATTFVASSLSNISPNRSLCKILDGFSKDCTAAKRAARRWNNVRSLTQIVKNPAIKTSQFTICSYNVLCQKTIARTSYLYRHLKSCENFLEWNHRWKGLQEELPTFDADVLGLQEVQVDHFEEHFEPFMRKHGYEGIYKQKYGTEQKDDGCAIFYRPEKFERVGYQEVNYFISPNSISNRENIGQILALRCRITGEIILVANTHLLFNEERGDVKLAQLAILFASIYKMRSDIGLSTQFKNSIPPVLVMGDFNMEPNSKIYDFIVNGKLFIEGESIRTMSGQSIRPGGKKCESAKLLFETTVGLNSMFTPSGSSGRLPVLDGYIRHPFQFFSAYHQGLTTSPHQTRKISTYHKDAAAPDFIFFTKENTKSGDDKLQLLECFDLPTYDTLTSAVPWPNRHVPSDHLPIMAKFELTKATL